MVRKTKNFLAIIPARAGSKGLKNKNIHPLFGKPLICWTIEEALKSNQISEIIVSSDSDIILELSSKYPVTIHKRIREFAKDDTKSEDVIINILEEIKELKNNYKYVILLQPTSPLRKSEHIEKACKKIIKEKTDSLISVKKNSNLILKTLIEDEKGGLKSGFNEDFPFTPRQQLPKTYMPNGAIYISKINSVLNRDGFLCKDNSFLEMDEISSQDIDSIKDLIKIEKVFKNTI